MLLCTILLNQRRSEVEVEVFGEKLVQKNETTTTTTKHLLLKLNKSLGELQPKMCAWCLPMRRPVRQILL